MKKSDSRAKSRALARALAEPHPARQGEFDCTEWLDVATPAQLRTMADADLWRADAPGGDESFDAARFGEWIDALAESSPNLAAQRITELDRGIVVAGLARHIRVFDRAIIPGYEMLDGTIVPTLSLDHDLEANLEGFVIGARTPESWDAIVMTLTALAADNSPAFHEIMAAVRAFSTSMPELDASHQLLALRDQMHFDLGLQREGRRAAHGYVSAGEARVFLEAARRRDGGRLPSAATEISTALVPTPDRTARLPWLRARMTWLAEHRPALLDAANADLAYLTNALISGGSVQGRAFTSAEAAEAVGCTCNLALQKLNAPDDIFETARLRDVFQFGWTSLHDDVAMAAADRLIDTLAQMRCRDPLIRGDLDRLRRELLRHLRSGAPWRARPRMEVLAAIDAPAWAALTGLIDECPVRHAALGAATDLTMHSIEATSFDFISSLETIADIERFLWSLPRLLDDGANLPSRVSIRTRA